MQIKCTWKLARFSSCATNLQEAMYCNTRGLLPCNQYCFPCGTNQIEGRIQAPIKQGQRLPADPTERQQTEQFDRQLLSFWQSAEWGMRSLQGSFGRLRVPLEVAYVDRRGDLLEICVRLQNFRTRLVGINQIRSVYMPLWRANEQEELWESFENMLFSEQRTKDRVSRFHLEYSN